MIYANKLLPGLEDLKPTPQLLNALLEELDLTNPMAAELLGTTYQTISRWLLGQSPINRGNFRLLLLLCFLKRGQAMIRVSWSTPEGESDEDGDDRDDDSGVDHDRVPGTLNGSAQP